MPEQELWPEGPGSAPETRLSSWDSMTSATSTHSGSSDNSYDFLSAEEKECLLFLEETIGSLDGEAESVLSTDQSEPATTPTPRGFRALPITQPALQGNPEETITQLSPEPRGVTEIPSSCPPEGGLGLRSGSYSLPRNIHISRDQNFRKSSAQTDGHFSGRGSEGHVAEPGKEGGSQSSEPLGTPANPQRATLGLDAVLIPPPKAFQDTWPEKRGEDSLPEGLGEQSHAPPKREEAMSHTASKRGTAGAPGRAQPPPAQWPQDARAEDAPLPSGDDSLARVGPVTAPKPRKLPPNIVLKSSRSSFHSEPQSWLSRHSEAADAAPGSSSLQEQRKARREALKKLGLPQDQEEPSLHLSHPASSIRLKKTQAQGPTAGPAPPQPVALAPVSAVLPAAEKAPAWAQASSPGKVCTTAQEAPPGKATAHKSMPIPIPKTPKANSPLAGPKPDSGPTLQESSIPGLKQMNFKSNTLERSGIGLSSYLSAGKDPSPQTSTSLGKDSILEKTSPSVLRNSRPRPASLGTGKDFAGIQVGKLAELGQGQSSKHLSYQGQSRDKLPRPLCVSVKISPKGVPDGHRREALKKLGLLKE
ncbi:specifically androgen-regulated gene protein isoform X1 [Heterocephalus glaber]|uniref:Specifically androgen-regulated gene protein isoform X1 n=1 Tax=Heterocephalus glaber TaxID=10181 RepID=A0AAX6PWR5_HETGA|nr:specifically androgen-regulated gene protein isoform X1 [Heterocephalus glaber]XP_004862111.1 specifically androgen-regulated gene protein isoform X1 [Heterocephalus glaber]